MKLKTRLVVAFLTVVILPVILSGSVIFAVGKYQMNCIEKTYGISETSVESLSNSIKTLGQLTTKPYRELCDEIDRTPQKMEDAAFLEKINQELEEKKSYLLVRRNDMMAYVGTDYDEAEAVISQLPKYDENRTPSENSIYLGGEAQALVKQIDFQYEDGEEGSAFLVTDVGTVMPEVRAMAREIVIIVVLILLFTIAALIVWIYRAVMGPVAKIQKAAENIKNGNLDFEMPKADNDEFGQVYQNFEDMRIRLKESAEEKIQFDKENKELISNISHDLKTPITAIKGYVEGILDGVASSPEKLDKYIRTIYNKSNDMDRLIDELTFYSKIDTNKIPYTFNKINVNSYFRDCAEEVGLDMESRGIELGYFNYVNEDVEVIADAEQMKRVINNIISNSVKYLDKPKGIINIRIKDVGDFIQVEIEDNGRGIATKDLPYIFDRFYRTDSSRNSSKGGSGIGLSIVKKIIEDHGGRIWATSKEGIGTEMHFVLRKYQEVIQNEQQNSDH